MNTSRVGSVLALLLLVVMGAAVVDVRGTAVVAPDEIAPVSRPAVAGAWFCVVGESRLDDELMIVAALDPDRLSGAEVSFDVFGGGSVDRVPSGRVGAGTGVAHVIESSLSGIGAVSRWWEQPTAVGRVWTAKTPGRPTGLVEAPCVASPATTWIVPGMRTDGGSTAEVQIGNPFGSAATVAMTLTTPGGPLSPLRLENLVVPARSTITVPINEHAPQQPDLGAIVQVRSGRVVVEGLQALNSVIGGIDGLSILQASSAPAEVWTFPWFEDGPDEASWLWVTNPSLEDQVDVEVTVHTELGGTSVVGFTDLGVPPGSTRRLSLDGILAAGGFDAPVALAGREALLSSPTLAGLTVTALEGVPFVASIATAFAEPGGADAQDLATPLDPADEAPTAESAIDATGAQARRTGVVVQLGASQADRAWTVIGGPEESRAVRLQLVNPSGEEAVLDVVLWSPVGVTAPAELRDLRVPPGTVRTIDLDPFLLGPASVAFVQVRQGEVVAGRRAFQLEGSLDVSGSVGVPARTFRPTAVGVRVQESYGLTERLGTSSARLADER